jgi:exopolyphosphatase/guanosine-5'-triphosphate,3'-diphosphate pyrophosphatase
VSAPRWEWRTFGDGVGPAEHRLAALPTEREQSSDELYLLSASRGATVKIRDGLLDVKRLEAVDADGLEQWRPVLKAPFPLAADELSSVLAALGVEAPLARPVYTLDELLDEVVGPSSALAAARTHKRRRHYLLDGCMAELTDVESGGAATRTIAVEHEDAGLVLATVRALGLAARPNVGFPRGLAALVGFGARRFAVIDVGTNSVKFHVGERLADGTWRTIVDRSEVTRLGEGLAENGRLQPGPIERTVDAIAVMAREAHELGAEAIAAVGTAGMRMAPNRDELVDAVEARCGVRIEVVSGEEESRLAFQAVEAGLGLPPGSLVVFDTGGGSSQFTFGRGGRVDERFSVDVGAVRFTERFGLDGIVPPERLAEALDAIAADLSRLDGRPAPDALVGLGGAVTNLAAVKHGLAAYDPDVVQGTVLDAVEVERQLELYRTRTADERREIVGLQPKRAEVILAGACVVRTVMRKLGRDELTVSDRGLRHGLIAERFGG